MVLLNAWCESINSSGLIAPHFCPKPRPQYERYQPNAKESKFEQSGDLNSDGISEYYQNARARQ